MIHCRMDDHDPAKENKLFNQFVGAALQLSCCTDTGDKEAPVQRNTAHVDESGREKKKKIREPQLI